MNIFERFGIQDKSSEYIVVPEMDETTSNREENSVHIEVINSALKNLEDTERNSEHTSERKHTIH